MAWVLGAAMAGCAAGESDNDIDAAPVFGFPVAGDRALQIIDNTGFTLGYDSARRQAAWVAYRLAPIGAYRHLPRPPFEADPRIDTPAPLSRYAGPAYDRGHLAPNYAISQLYGETGQRETFYYSNIAAQRPRLNQLVWQRFEEIEIDDIAERVQPLWVIAGPIPSSDGEPPEAFFRVWVARDARHESWRALAFRIPQTVRGDERLDSFIVSIDRIEAETGLDLLAGLADDQQARLEARPARATTFGFAALACQPARYGRRWQGRDGLRLRYDRCADFAGATARGDADRENH